MTDHLFEENEFLLKLTSLVEDNLSNESFGVSELADAVGMSRSNLLRKVKKQCNLSVSQFIRQIRLENAKEILLQGDANVSEVAYQVGFSSTSYFIKCFRELYGYPPGETGKHEVVEETKEESEARKPNSRKGTIVVIIAVLLSILSTYFILNPIQFGDNEVDKSIAVLPFKNDSKDSANVYIVNGLMESVLNHLQKIEDVRVISRTSVEKYRNSNLSIPEIAKELNVSYFVEGSGQKIGDQILLNIQLIKASNDTHLWAEQYDRQAQDIFKLQREVAKKIASSVEAIITPEEEELMDKTPTDNLEAYDEYLKALELMRQEKREVLLEAIAHLDKAIELDPEFARAYAFKSMGYYYLDIFKAEKLHVDKVVANADQAMLYDSKDYQSLIAKALSYLAKGENAAAIPYFERALEYQPNSAYVLNNLSNFYANFMPNSEKYLEYALRGIQLNIAANDSVTASYIYLHISNALIQTGFVEESELYINKSLDHNPNNLFSEYLRAFVLLAKNKDLEETKQLLITAWNKDQTRLDILQEIGKICYYQRDYQEAYKYYSIFVKEREERKLDIYAGEDSKIAHVYKEVGKYQEAKLLFDSYREFANTHTSIYKHLSLAVCAVQEGDRERAFKELERFAEEDQFSFWVILFLEDDPLLEEISDTKEYKEFMQVLKKKFDQRHERLKKVLKDKKLI
ncbi:helix-turn-helix domain-containing protein [Marinifilum caeruleilacunae]|uniref:Helix-turn-helix domain-containing protein n=1 Tax=Marinifilum caeruleilacunae TaxID=2499076 RepID=A0ABX1WVV9_9BACT|nr:helix-turn-helix domain-containing protein [Marinifilum caeruleilacunae]NOU60141.1 helix-turn-helix domain-containing protein [Marinifilum caeruleilacunae]